jgi:anti-sigma factor RsiW
MTCELWRDQITAYVDGELALSHDEEVSRHLRQCGECTLYAAGELHVKRAVGNAGMRYKPSDELRKQVMKSIGAEAPRVRWRLMAPVLVAAWVLVVGSVLFVMRQRSQSVDRELADIHLNTISSANPVEVVSTDMHTVKPWFQGRIPFSFNLPELSGSPFTLLGARVVYLRGTPCALLVFQFRKHLITTVIGPAQVVSVAGQLPGGFHAAQWEKGGYRYVSMGDAGGDTVADISGRLKAVN